MIDEKNPQAETYREKQRIKTHYARVIVGSNPDKPYYGIEYYNPTDGEYQEGFGSYDLNNVLRWLEEEFEIVEQTEHEKALEAAKVIQEYCNSRPKQKGNAMTTKEAVEILDKLTRGSIATLHHRSGIEALEMAIVAMERQIPKKPFLKDGESIIHVNKGDEPHEWIKEKWQDWVCPVCGWFVGQRYNAVRNNGEVHPHDQRKSNFCNECGQAIDWGNEDD